MSPQARTPTTKEGPMMPAPPDRYPFPAGRALTNLGRYWRRLRLERTDGRVYLERWGLGGRLFGVYVHRMTAPDPGVDLHDHPWSFVSIILHGWYTERRCDRWTACDFARAAVVLQSAAPSGRTVRAHRGIVVHRRRGSIRRMTLDETHTIEATAPVVWTLVLRGPVEGSWGFYTPAGYVNHRRYDSADRPFVTEQRNPTP